MLTQSRLAELATYDPTTGVFICVQNRRGSKNKVGDVLGSLTAQGYIAIQFDNKRYLAHRLAVLAMTGKMPEKVVDHINRNRTDNRWTNLRCVSQVENAHNQDREAKRNSTGFVGVHRWQGRYRAKIVVNHKQKHLGTFDYPDLAAAAYTAAKKELQPTIEH
jgi:hypothetical protein